MSEAQWWLKHNGEQPVLPEPTRPCAHWIERTRKAEAENEQLRSALRMAREWAARQTLDNGDKPLGRDKLVAIIDAALSEKERGA